MIVVSVGFVDVEVPPGLQPIAWTLQQCALDNVSPKSNVTVRFVENNVFCICDMCQAMTSILS